MPSLNVEITRRSLFQSLVVVALLTNVLLILGGVILKDASAGGINAINSASAAELRAQLETLDTRLEQAQPISADDAADRILGQNGLFQLSDQLGAQIWTLENETVEDRIGTRDVKAFMTTVELRGPRENVLAVLWELPIALEGNILIDNVDVKGVGDSWSFRATIRQIIA